MAVTNEVVSRVESVDICALVDKFVIQAKARFAKVSSLSNQLLVKDFRPLHKLCQNGDHYMARKYVTHSLATLVCSRRARSSVRESTTFYIIKGDKCTEVDDLETGSNCMTYTLDDACQGGSAYFANRAGFYIIHGRENTYLELRVPTLCKGRINSLMLQTEELREDFRDGLYYFATDDFFYVVKRDPVHGLVYHRGKSLSELVNDPQAAMSIPISDKKMKAFLQNQADLPDPKTEHEVPVEGVEITEKFIPVEKFCNNPEHKVNRIVCNETFKKKLETYLKSSDRELVEIKENYMDDAFEGAHYSYTDAMVDTSTIEEFDTIDDYIGNPIVYRNHETTLCKEQYQQIVSYNEGLEYSKTNCSQWSISGGLSVTYQGAGATTGIGYTRSQSKTVKKIKTTTHTQVITKTVSVPARHCRKVVLTQRFHKKECQAKGVTLIFPDNAKIKCKFFDKSDPKGKVRKEKFLLQDVLRDCIEDQRADQLTCKLDGKYVWVETSVFLDIKHRQPL